MNDLPDSLKDGLSTVLGQPALTITANDGSRATVLLHGGHLVSWIPAGADEQLYLSPKAVAAPGQAVRGGVPVIFPQFEQLGPDTSLPRHGLARTRPWQVDSHHARRDHTQLTLVLTDDADTRALWPHGFRLELTISVGGPRLDLELYAENIGDTPWDFAAALHTYLAVSDLTQVRLEGLQGCRYQDRLLGGMTLEDHPEKRFHGEMDRIYHSAPDLLLRDGPRRLSLRSQGFEDAVVWNPGPEKCAALKDMPPDGWQQMLCVEPARIQSPVTLQPGESWAGLHTLALVGAD